MQARRRGGAAPSAPFALVALLLASGCAAPAGDEAGAAELHLLALDGRWGFDPAHAAELLAEAGAPAPRGRLVWAEALGPRALDVVGLDEGAAAALGLAPPARGLAVASAASGLAAGDALALRGHAWPAPYVATYFEMERVRPCDEAPEAKLCALPPARAGEARLRLLVDEGARDLALLPDLVELGPRGVPAWWNGSFVGPDGLERPAQAIATRDGLVEGEVEGEVPRGAWEIRFTIEANGTLTAPAAAGIVRVREPGHHWFDDRLQRIPSAAAQAQAILGNATPTRAQVRVERVVDALPLGADLVLALDDARALAGGAEATGVLVDLTPAQARALDAARGPDGVTLSLRPRALVAPARDAPAEGALVFAAPAGVALADLPRVEGALAPALALAGRAPLAEPARVDGAPLGGALLLLAHADGAVPWGLPDGARWASPEAALEELARSRTLALASADITEAPVATLRVELGSGSTMRTLLDAGGVVGGPSLALWTSPAFVAGAGQPLAPRVLLPLAPGAERADVLARASELWAPLGVVPAR